MTATAEAIEAVDRWKRDASDRICVGSGRPVLKPGHMFGTCSVCGKGPLLVHDGPPDYPAWRHPEATADEVDDEIGVPRFEAAMNTEWTEEKWDALPQE